MSFQFIKKEFLPTIGITLEVYEHTATGAMHYHFSSEQSENVFMVALRTMPEDSTGVAHILEHTALCGSKHFPVRDPFFSMLRRSLQTFMNAFTSSDWTAYPFATENRQDFDNLLQIYLDAVFFPRLDRLDFLQEGHRLEWDNNTLVTKGVVYNEMKGVYGNAHERIFETQKSFLQPSTTYHHDSGGTPSHILDLTYEDFLAFHKKHYHPTNATFFTFGNIPAHEHHARFEELALKHFSGKGEKVMARDEKRFIAPLTVEAAYPSTDTENPHQVHILVSWLLGASYHAHEYLEAELITRLLLDNSASPLRKALENAEWSASPSPLCMLDNSGRELRFSAGLVTDSKNNTQKTEALILDTLTQCATDGFAQEDVEAVLDQLELALREQSTGYPYGLSLFLTAITGAIHGGEIAKLLDPTDILDELRTKIQDSAYVKEAIKRLFLENAHRLTLTMVPDLHAGHREDTIEADYHTKLARSLSEDEKNAITSDAQKLKERQEKGSDDSILPRLTSVDIPKEVRDICASRSITDNVAHYTGSTNMISYRSLFFPLVPNSLEEYADMALVAELIAEVGTKKTSYLDLQKEIARKTGSLNAGIMNGTMFGTDTNLGFLRIGMRCLERSFTGAQELLETIATETAFHEVSHIRDVFSEKLLSMKSAFLHSGHHVAMMRASSGNTLTAALAEKTSGIESMYHVKDFLAKTDTEITQTCTSLYEKATQNAPLVCQIDAHTHGGDSHGTLQTVSYTLPHQAKKINEAWIADTAISYCALSFPVIRSDHPDAPALTVLGQFLRDGFLHTAIREKGGAYGSGARYNADAEAFEFFSYRDPRIEGTYNDFRASIAWLLENEHDPLRLEEAKLGIFATLDRPASVAAEAKEDFKRNIYGYTKEIRNARREALLAVTIDDLKRVAQAYISDFDSASRVVITGDAERKTVESLGFTVQELV